MRRVRIESDGHFNTMRVVDADTGELLPVRSVLIKCSPATKEVIAFLEVVNVELKISCDAKLEVYGEGEDAAG